MLDEKSSKDLKKKELFDQLLDSLEERGKKIHVIYPDFDSGETKKKALDRYCAETGASIRASDIVLMVIYDDHLQPDG